MAKKEKKVRVKKEKSEGRKPTLAPYVDAPFKVYMNVGGKERDAQVLSSGILTYKEKEFTSPSSLATFIMHEAGQEGRADGWKTLKYNKDGERVQLDTLRGSKSPLKATEKAPAKPRAAKKANGAPKATRRAKKAATKLLKATEAAAEQLGEATA